MNRKYTCRENSRQRVWFGENTREVYGGLQPGRLDLTQDKREVLHAVHAKDYGYAEKINGASLQHFKHTGNIIKWEST